MEFTKSLLKFATNLIFGTKTNKFILINLFYYIKLLKREIVMGIIIFIGAILLCLDGSLIRLGNGKK